MATFTSKNIAEIKAEAEKVASQKLNLKAVKTGSMKGYVQVYPKASAKIDGIRCWKTEVMQNLKETFGMGQFPTENFITPFYAFIYIGMEEIWNQTL